MKIYVVPLILASTILLVANYSKQFPPPSFFTPEQLKSLAIEFREKYYSDSLKIAYEEAERKKEEKLDSIKHSPQFTSFSTQIKQGKVSFKKWLKHKWLGYPQFGNKEAYFSRWETTATYLRGWYGLIWFNFYENLERATSNEEKWLMIFVKYYRDAELIEELFKTYEPQIYQAITQKEFAQGNIKECLEELLAAHKIITQNSHYKEEFEKLKNIDEEEKRLYFFKKAFPENQDKSLKKNKYAPQGAESWFYSFWYRRYTEGNMEVVYKIIHKVYWHYQNHRKSIF